MSPKDAMLDLLNQQIQDTSNDVIFSESFYTNQETGVDESSTVKENKFLGTLVIVSFYHGVTRGFRGWPVY